jgi:hypothetical protein
MPKRRLPAGKRTNNVGSNPTAATVAYRNHADARENRRRYYRLHAEQEKEAVKLRRKATFEWLATFKFKCGKCPECRLGALDFHHRDRSQKVIAIGAAVSNGWSREKIAAEIKKCDIICSNCHRVGHLDGSLE